MALICPLVCTGREPLHERYPRPGKEYDGAFVRRPLLLRYVLRFSGGTDLGARLLRMDGKGDESSFGNFGLS